MTAPAVGQRARCRCGHARILHLRDGFCTKNNPRCWCQGFVDALLADIAESAKEN